MCIFYYHFVKTWHLYSCKGGAQDHLKFGDLLGKLTGFGIQSYPQL
jgi:hypothetical protein